MSLHLLHGLQRRPQQPRGVRSERQCILPAGGVDEPSRVIARWVLEDAPERPLVRGLRGLALRLHVRHRGPDLGSRPRLELVLDLRHDLRAGGKLAKRLTAAISSSYGFEPRVVLLTRSELERAVEDSLDLVDDGLRRSPVARDLLGCVLVSRIGRALTAGRIVETEAYIGPHDPACHAYGGRRTPRTDGLYGPPGTAYIYFTYGMHWCLNAVTETVDYPAAVLIRALEPLEGLGVMRRRRGSVPDRALCAGPARLCSALGVTGTLNGTSLERAPLRIVRAPRPARLRIVTTPRVGITRATDWPLRFCLAGSPWVSRAPWSRPLVSSPEKPTPPPRKR